VTNQKKEAAAQRRAGQKSNWSTKRTAGQKRKGFRAEAFLLKLPFQISNPYLEYL